MKGNNIIMRTKNFNGYQNIVGKTIKKYRELQGLSQRDLANKVALLGVTLYNSDISRIENNTLFLRDYEEYAICKVLGISISQLPQSLVCPCESSFLIIFIAVSFPNFFPVKFSKLFSNLFNHSLIGHTKLFKKLCWIITVIEFFFKSVVLNLDITC